MKQRTPNNKLVRQRLSVGLALLLCLFFSHLDYLGQAVQDTGIEQQGDSSDDREQTFLSVAVDAVVPFALQVTQTIFHLIYQVLDFDQQNFSIDIPSVGYAASLGEVFFERIISPQGP